MVEGFTLIELLLVIAIIAILAALMLPSISSVKLKSGQVVCASNLKQLAVAAQLYSSDNNGRLAENLPEAPTGGPLTNTWVLGDMKKAAQATNVNLLKQGTLFPYASQPAVYRCPADSSQEASQLRVRSYSMNGWFGSRYMESYNRPTSFRTFVREAEVAVARPAALWLIEDEHEASIDDGWFLVTMDDSRPFASAPASRHQRGYGLNFADGHAEIYKLRDPGSGALGQSQAQFSTENADWLRLKQITTLR